MSTNNRVGWVIVSLGLCTLSGCAEINYVKVPTPTQHERWTDQDQRRADAMKGVRYY